MSNKATVNILDHLKEIKSKLTEVELENNLEGTHDKGSTKVKLTYRDHSRHLEGTIEHLNELIEVVYSYVNIMCTEIEEKFEIPFAYERKSVSQFEKITGLTNAVYQKKPVDIKCMSTLYFWTRKICEEIENGYKLKQGDVYKKNWIEIPFTDPENNQQKGAWRTNEERVYESLV